MLLYHFTLVFYAVNIMMISSNLWRVYIKESFVLLLVSLQNFIQFVVAKYMHCFPWFVRAYSLVRMVIIVRAPHVNCSMIRVLCVAEYVLAFLYSHGAKREAGLVRLGVRAILHNTAPILELGFRHMCLVRKGNGTYVLASCILKRFMKDPKMLTEPHWSYTKHSWYSLNYPAFPLLNALRLLEWLCVSVWYS